MKDGADSKGKRSGKKSDEQILHLLETYERTAIGGDTDTVQSEERKRIRKYLDLELPARNAKGSSTYVSQDVYEAKQWMHDIILETFCGSRQLVKFTPTGPEDVDPCLAQTEYCSYVLFSQNRGLDIMSDVIDDGLTSRMGVVKVWWEEGHELEDAEVPEPIADEQLEVLDDSLSDDVEEIAAVPLSPKDLLSEHLKRSPDGVLGAEAAALPALYRVTLRTRVDTSQVRIAQLPPEEFLVSKKAKSIQDAGYVCHRQRKSYAYLSGTLKLSDEKISQIGDDSWLDDMEVMERFRDVDGGEYSSVTERECEGKSAWVKEEYIRANLDGSGVRLWKCLRAGKLLIDKERVKVKPFLAFVPLRVPHRLQGDNYCARVIPAQTTNTALVRAIVDHTMVTTTPRWLVKNGGLPRPQELMDNRLGGIVNTVGQDAVLPLPQAPLNPYTFQLGQLIGAKVEDTTGVSRRSRGLDKDALSHGNSAALNEQVTDASQVRQKVIARNFAQFLCDLYVMISDLVIENERRERVIEVAGQHKEVNPSTWRRRSDMAADPHLGYGEDEKEASKLLQMHQLLIGDPEMRSQYTPAGKHRMWGRILELSGIKDTGNYVLPADKAQPPQPNPAEQAAMQEAQHKMQMEQGKLQLAQQEAQFKQQHLMAQLGLDKQRLAFEQSKQNQAFELDKLRLGHDISIDNQEMQVVKTAEPEQTRAIASPNS